MDRFKYIEINPQIMLSKPVIRGTRIRVELILEKLANSETIEDILVAYPHLTSEIIHIVLAEYQKLDENKLR